MVFRFINFALHIIVMKQNKEVKISYIATHLTTIVSVTLVLVLMGIISIIWLAAGRETHRLREQIEVSVIMADTITDAQSAALASELRSEPYALKVKSIGKAEAMRKWKADTGEDLEALFGVNPLSPEIDITLRAEASTPENISKIGKSLQALPGVADVSAPDTRMVETINRSLSGLTLLLGGIAVVILIISFVLINNTVHLTIYSRRFTIHTMQLVGATNSYIRRPVVLNNMMCGLVAGIFAAGILAAGIALAPQAGIDNIISYVSWPELGAVGGGLTLAGMLICSIAAAIAAARYLHKDYDDLFK